MSFNFPSSPTIDQVYGEYYWDGEKWAIPSAAAFDNLLLETGPVVPYLVGLVGLVPAQFNMGPWTKDAVYTDFNWADTGIDGHPSGFTKAQVTVSGTLVAAPDGTTTGQKIVETAAGGTHLVFSFNGPQLRTSPNISFRVAAIVKAAERTRVVITNEVYSHEAVVSASVGFDLVGGNVGYDIAMGSSTVVTAYSMTALGDGWWLCQFDMNYTGTLAAYDFVFQPKLFLDSGSGTAARSVSYGGVAGNGIYAWWLNVLPAAAWSLTDEVWRDDFNSLSGFDMANTLNPGFDWYLGNCAPNSLNTTWWACGSTLPASLPGNFTISSPSVLKLYNPNNNAPKWGTMIYTVGFPVSGGYVGRAWQAPMMMDGMFQWDNSTHTYADYAFLGPAFWGHTVEAMAGTMNPSKHWMEWDISDIGTLSGMVADEWLDATNAPTSTANAWSAGTAMLLPAWHRISGLWLNMPSTNSGQGFFMQFFDGSFAQYSDVVYSASDYPQPPGSKPKGWNSQCDWQHMPIMLDTGNNTAATAGAGWPMWVDYVRVIQNPAPPKIYDYWNVFDQPGNLIVGNNGLQLTKTVADSAWNSIRASFGKSSGQWYWEMTITGTVAVGTSLLLGIMSEAASVASYPGGSPQGASAQHSTNWNALVNGVTGAFSGTVTFASGDVFGFAFDADTGKIYIHRNGTWVSGAPSGGAAVWTGLTGHTWYPAAAIYNAGAVTIATNFGKAAFAYTIPGGYLGLSAN